MENVVEKQVEPCTFWMVTEWRGGMARPRIFRESVKLPLDADVMTAFQEWMSQNIWRANRVLRDQDVKSSVHETLRNACND